MFHIIFNPVAGKKKAAKNLSVVEKIFTENNIEFTVHQSHAERDAEKIVQAVNAELYDMAAEYIWSRTINILNKNDLPLCLCKGRHFLLFYVTFSECHIIHSNTI